jgi:hypothetical protein
MVSDFIQVLNSAREVYTNNYYFSNSKLFSTISLLQKLRFNHSNYSKQELIMISFAQANDHDVHMRAKIQYLILHRFL